MDPDQTRRTFLFLSDSNSDAATSQLAVAGIHYKKKKLESSPANWLSICDIIDNGEIVAALIKLTTHTMRAMIGAGYRDPAEELLRRISDIPNIVFVHASFFESTTDLKNVAAESEDDWFGAFAHFGSLEERECKEVMKMLERHGIELMPYRRNVELSVLAAQFVDDHRRNLVFRFYVPAGRLWAEQAGTLLDLFIDYLTKAMGLAVRTSSHSSRNGTTYEFFTDGAPSTNSIETRLPAFAAAMNLCVSDPDGAERLLVEQGADAHEVARLVTSYAKRMKRIAIDARQERETKVLALRHRLEDDLEAIAAKATPEAIAMLVEQVVPRSDQPAGILLGLSGSRTPPPLSNLTVNYRPQFIAHVEGMVAQEVNGTQNFSPDAQRLLDLIERTGGPRSRELASALHELEDGSASDAIRLASVGKLREFLRKAAVQVGDKVVDAAIAAGQAYLQNRFGI